MMRKIGLHVGFIFLTVGVATGLGWFIGTQEFARWTQNYAEMNAENPELLKNAPLVKFEKSYDLGVLYGEVGTVTHDFSVTNTGLGVLKLSDPIPEDDSVICALPKKEIEPDETIYVTISYTPQAEEDFNASVTIQTNVPSTPEMEISLFGSVHAAVWPAETTVEVGGVPTLSVFKASNLIFSLVKGLPLEISNLHVVDPQYADFFSFKTTDAYNYDFSEVIPKPEFGKIVTIVIKPGLPSQITRVIVEGETNIPETPKIQFNIDFKLSGASPIPGMSGGLVPILPAESSETGTPETETPAETSETETPAASTPEAGTSSVPEIIDLESDSK